MNQVAAMIRRITLRLVMFLHEPSHTPTHDSDGSWYVSYTEEILHHRKMFYPMEGRIFGIQNCLHALWDCQISGNSAQQMFAIAFV